MTNLTDEVLKTIEAKGSLDTYEYANATGKEHQSVVGVIKSIQALGDVSLNTASYIINVKFHSNNTFR